MIAVEKIDALLSKLIENSGLYGSISVAKRDALRAIVAEWAEGLAQTEETKSALDGNRYHVEQPRCGTCAHDYSVTDGNIDVASQDDIAAFSALINAQSAPPPAKQDEWRCFHCGEVITSRVDAQNHFGGSEIAEPAYLIKAPGEFALLNALRNAEQGLIRHRQEDSDVIRAMHSMQTDHATALRREEERGYARGIEDAKKHPETIGLQLAAPIPSRLEFYAVVMRDMFNRAPPWTMRSVTCTSEKVEAESLAKNWGSDYRVARVTVLNEDGK